jgi:primase-polymerase (primpol)-like protein
MRQVHSAYARLRNDPEQWADYQQELRLAETTDADGIGSARDEYPEYNQ